MVHIYTNSDVNDFEDEESGKCIFITVSIYVPVKVPKCAIINQ